MVKALTYIHSDPIKTTKKEIGESSIKHINYVIIKWKACVFYWKIQPLVKNSYETTLHIQDPSGIARLLMKFSPLFHGCFNMQTVS